MKNDYIMSDEEFEEFLNEPPEEINSWLNKEYLIEISDALISLNDFVPQTIILHLPDPGARKRFVTANVDLRESNYLFEKHIQERTDIWEDYVSLFDEFFERHPEFSKLIESKEVYNKWRTEGDFC